MPPKLDDYLHVMKQKYEEILIHVENKLNVGFILEFEVQNWKKKQ
jgi:hypothetical protein